jgi:hypothetical protein
MVKLEFLGKVSPPMAVQVSTEATVMDINNQVLSSNFLIVCRRWSLQPHLLFTLANIIWESNY